MAARPFFDLRPVQAPPWSLQRALRLPSSRKRARALQRTKFAERAPSTCASQPAFFGASKRAGLNCEAREANSTALSKYLGVVIPSRASLSAGQWSEAVATVEFGLVRRQRPQECRGCKDLGCLWHLLQVAEDGLT